MSTGRSVIVIDNLVIPPTGARWYATQLDLANDVYACRIKEIGAEWGVAVMQCWTRNRDYRALSPATVKFVHTLSIRFSQ